MKPVNSTKILVGAMLPFITSVLNMFMFATALPFIRRGLNLPADTTSWIVIAYTVPSIVFMPFFGIWGDALGKRRLMLAGMTCFCIGSIVCAIAANLQLIIIGRAIQGIGAAAVTPLGIAIIYEYFNEGKRATMLGTWNTIGPVGSTMGPVLGGLLIDSFGWRSVFAPIAGVSILSLISLALLIPPDPHKRKLSLVVKSFDWLGLVLVACTLTSLVFFVSSRPLTGRLPFQDWRFLSSLVVFASLLFFRERKAARPYFAFRNLAVSSFRNATLCVAARMVVLGGINFLIPLYASEIRNLPAATVGLMIMVHGAGFLFTMRLSGVLADRWSSKWPPRIGLLLQTVMLVCFALLPATAPTVILVSFLVTHGAASGLSLAALNYSALRDVKASETGSAAGFYAMLRFTGSLFGATIVGIILRFGLENYQSVIKAYQVSFAALVAAAFFGFVIASRLRD